MKAAMRAELLKLITVRSTYIMFILSVVLIGVFAFYVYGIRAEALVLDPLFIMDGMRNTVQTIAVFPALAVLLLVTHEYRYNTILYTFTSTRSRTNVLLAKTLAGTMFVALFMVVAVIISVLASRLGLALGGSTLAPQSIYYLDILWSGLLYAWVYTMLSFIMALIIRNQIGAIAAMFILPGTLEGLLGILLKDNAKYLPYSALSGIMYSNNFPADMHVLARSAQVIVVLAYVAAGLGISWYLYLKRDAS